eukprot:1565435-Pleurochrysis_carterae.AAC.2
MRFDQCASYLQFRRCAAGACTAACAQHATRFVILVQIQQAHMQTASSISHVCVMESIAYVHMWYPSRSDRGTYKVRETHKLARIDRYRVIMQG